MSVTDVESPPNLLGLYAKAAVSSVTPSGSEDLPDTRLRMRDVEVDVDHLVRYDRVCGFTLRDRLPATYLHVVAFPLAVQIMAAGSFPFPLPGLVHVANRITQHRPLPADGRYDVTVTTRDLRPHEKGRQFDVVGTATLDGEEVWTDVSTYLRRGGDGGSGDGGDSGDGGQDRPRGTEGADREAPPQASARWRVPGDIGRRYAAVSGDRNPIHLTRVTARLFGFPRPIAHGMWTAARALAAIDSRLPDAFTYDVRFKLPLLIPATVAFSAQSSAGGHRLGVHDARNGEPHLEAAVDRA
jgi:acyl dehydratase